MKKAISILIIFCIIFVTVGCGKKSVYEFPALEYLYNTSESHQAIGEYIQSALFAAGIKVNLSNQEWGTFLSTRKNGDYILARNGWLADYSDPISFLDMWTSDSGNNDIGFGKGNHKDVTIYSLDLRDEGYDVYVENGTWSQTYDKLISIIKGCADVEKRYRMMHLAEDMIMQTGCIMPLYFYTDVYMKDKALNGFYSSPLGYKIFKKCTYKGKNSISVSLASEPETIDPAFSSTVDAATLISHLFSGLAKWDIDESGNVFLAPDAAISLPEGTVNSDGSVTYVFTLKDGLKWSDGKTVYASDFEFSWKRAAAASTASNYGYMFQIIKGYGGESENLAVKALDDKRLEVTLSSAIPYFNELLAFQTFFPVREDVVKNESWATDAKTYISNGPYTMSAWEHNSQITITKNDAYPQSHEISMREIKFYLSDDANNMLANFKNGSWQLIDNIPTNEISSLKAAYPEEFFTKGEIGTYYISWNIDFDLLPFEKEMSKNEKAIASAEIRRAINLIPDRNYIADSIGQAGHIPASSFVALGIKNPDGSEFSSTSGNNENYSGYFDVSKEAYKSNVFYALDVLKKYYSLDIPK